MSRHFTPRRLVLLVALCALGLVAGVLVTRETNAPGGTPLQPGDQASQADAASTSSTAPQEPDVLVDPDVAPGQCRMVDYTPPTATDVHQAKLCRPAANQRDVAVVLVHGGGGISGAYTSMDGWSRRLLAEGYVTLQPAYHLFVEGGGESPVFPLPEQNIKAAVQYVRGTGDALGIRKDRIVLQGHSAGARLGSVAFTTADDAFFAGPELYPDLSDDVNGFIGFYHPYDGTMQNALQYYGGSSEDDDPVVQRRWAKADALSRAERADAPALFIVGRDDWDVIDEQQDEFTALLVQDGQRAEAIVIDDGAHGFDLGGNRLTRLGEEAAVAVLDFLNRVFPQVPPRSAQSVDVDLSTSPTLVGTPPTTVQTRTRTPRVTSTVPRRSTPTTRFPAASSSTTKIVTTSTSTAPAPTTTATTEAPPPTTATTQAPPPTTTATTEAPPTAP